MTVYILLTIYYFKESWSFIQGINDIEPNTKENIAKYKI